MSKRIEIDSNTLGQKLQGVRKGIAYNTKNLVNQMQQDVDRCTSAIFQELRPYLQTLQETTTEYKIVMVPSVRFSSSAIAPHYDANIRLEWHIFALPTDGSNPATSSMHIIKLCMKADKWSLYQQIEEKLRYLNRQYGLTVNCDIPFSADLVAKAIGLT